MLIAADVWRLYELTGVPSSGAHQPNKNDIIAWGSLLESMLGAGTSGLAYTTLAVLNADLLHGANTSAIVYGDATPANNGFYVKSGASGSGSWLRVGDLPNSIVRLTVTGGTGNAIVATAPETPTLPGTKLYLMTPSASCTGPSGISINAGTQVPIKSALGSDTVTGSLIAGSQVLMAWSVDHYQLLISVPVDATGILNDAVAARDTAVASALAAASTAASLATAPGGRLTLASGQPVMSASVTAATTLYYAPFTGTSVPVNTGGAVSLHSFIASPTDAVGLSIALGSNWAANTNYDVFAAMNSSTLRLATGPGWDAGSVPGSNTVGSSTRGTGAGSTELQLYLGYMTNKNSITLRYANGSTFTAVANEATYLGSFRTGAAGQISFTYGAQGTAGSFYLWNCYNQVLLGSTSSDSTSSWTYASTTIRQANASALNQFNFIQGLASGFISARIVQNVRPVSTATATGRIGIALNSTTTYEKKAQITTPAASTMDGSLSLDVNYKPQLGANFISQNESGDGATNTTFFGQDLQQISVSMMV